MCSIFHPIAGGGIRRGVLESPVCLRAPLWRRWRLVSVGVVLSPGLLRRGARELREHDRGDHHLRSRRCQGVPGGARRRDRRLCDGSRGGGLRRCFARGSRRGNRLPLRRSVRRRTLLWARRRCGHLFGVLRASSDRRGVLPRATMCRASAMRGGCLRRGSGGRPMRGVVPVPPRSSLRPLGGGVLRQAHSRGAPMRGVGSLSRHVRLHLEYVSGGSAHGGTGSWRRLLGRRVPAVVFLPRRYVPALGTRRR